MYGWLVDANALDAGVETPRSLSAADVPGSTRSSRRPRGAGPLSSLTFTCTPSERGAQYGAVLCQTRCPRTSTALSSGLASSRPPRSVQFDQTPFARVRTATSRLVAEDGTQLTPTIEKPAADSSPVVPTCKAIVRRCGVTGWTAGTGWLTTGSTTVIGATAIATASERKRKELLQR